MVDKLTLLAAKRAVAVRDGVEVELELDQIVLDDLIKLGRGDQIPADAVVVSGEAQANESLLTGESNLIRKQPGSELMSGSFIDSGHVLARVVHVGADNYVARINERGEVRQEGQLRDHGGAQRHRAVRQRHHASAWRGAVPLERP